MGVTLSTFDAVFRDASWHWLQEEELRNLIDAPAITKEQQHNWFETLPQRADYCIWGVLFDGKPIGVTGIKNIQGTTGEYWGYIGDKNSWGRGIGKEMIELVIEAAKSMHLKELTLKVLKTNERAIRLYSKVGFVITDAGNTHLKMHKILS